MKVNGLVISNDLVELGYLLWLGLIVSDGFEENVVLFNHLNSIFKYYINIMNSYVILIGEIGGIMVEPLINHQLQALKEG